MSDGLSRIFAALADPTRRDIVARLTSTDATVSELAAPYAVSVQAVSKHLKVLEGAGLITRSRDGQRRPVHLEADVFDLMTKWIERYRRRAQARYQRLDAVLAEMAADRTPLRSEGTPIMKTDTYTDAVIEADPVLPIIRITRDFRATPAQLARAHLDPDLYLRWVGPDGISSRVIVWDARDGGEWSYVSERDGQEFRFRGCFHTVSDERIVQTFTYAGMPDDVTLETLRFVDLGDGRTRLEAQSLCDSIESRDAWLRSGMETGVTEGYAKLDRLLAAGDPA